MEPRLQAALKAMEELEKGAIANPDEGRMVGHCWLRNTKLAPKSFLRVQIENTLDCVCKFADDVISGKIRPPSSQEGLLKYSRLELEVRRWARVRRRSIGS